MLFVAILASALLVSSCGSGTTLLNSTAATSNTLSTSSQMTSTPQPEKTIKLGYLAYLGGPAGLDSLHAVQLLADLDNSNGGWNVSGTSYQVQIVGYDNNNDQATEVAAVNRMVFQDKVNFILSQGGFQDSWIPVAEQAKIVSFIGPTTTNMGLGPNYHYFFSGDFVNSQMSSFVGWFTKKYSDTQNNLVMAFPDNQIGHVLSGILESIWSHFGTTPKNIFYPASSSDLSSLGTQVVQANPKYFSCFTGSDSEDGQVFNAVNMAGYKGIMFTSSQTSSLVLSQTMSQQALEGFVCMASPTEFDPPPTQQAKDIKDAWTKKYGKWTEPNISVADDYLCLKAAVEKAGSLDSDAIAGLLSNGMKYDSLNGQSQMVSRPDLGNNKTVDSVATFYIKQVQNGKAQLLATISVDDAITYMSAMPKGPSGPPPGAPPSGDSPP